MDSVGFKIPADWRKVTVTLVGPVSDEVRMASTKLLAMPWAPGVEVEGSISGISRVTSGSFSKLPAVAATNLTFTPSGLATTVPVTAPLTILISLLAAMVTSAGDMTKGTETSSSNSMTMLSKLAVRSLGLENVMVHFDTAPGSLGLAFAVTVAAVTT
mgnify:CR=1 FL=1